MSRHVLARSPDCKDDHCPTFFDDPEAGGVWVRGYADPTAVEPGAPELDNFIPYAHWQFLITQLKR